MSFESFPQTSPEQKELTKKMLEGALLEDVDLVSKSKTISETIGYDSVRHPAKEVIAHFPVDEKDRMIIGEEQALNAERYLKEKGSSVGGLELL